MLIFLLPIHGRSDAQGLRKYANERYGFTMSYPSDFIMDPPPYNGDGRRFTKGDHCIVLGFGQNNVSDETLRSRSRSTKSIFAKVMRHASGRNWFSYAGIVGDKIVFVKSYVGTGSINEMRIEQPKSETPCSVKVTEVEKAFSPGDLNEGH